jgi:DNA-binding response OmpR family regulator
MTRQTVLLVEDDENDVFFMQRAFREAGIITPVSVACDGREAIDYMSGNGKFADRQNWPLPCLVLLDLKLPYVLGLDVLKWIRSHAEFKTVVVIVLTSSKQDADIEKAYSLGANSYLVKPPDVHELVAMVKKIKEYWIEMNQVGAPCVEFARGHSVALDNDKAA